MTTEIVEVETRVRDVSASIEIFRNTQIETVDQYLVFVEKLKVVKALQQEVNEIHDPSIAASHKAHKEALKAKARVAEPLNGAEMFFRSRIAVYLDREEDKRRIEQRRLQLLAEKQAEDMQVAEAAQAEKEGRHEVAEQIISQPTPTPAVALPPSVPKVEGFSQSETWACEVSSLLDLAKGVCAGTVPLEAIQANMTHLNAMARTLKGNLKYPGVKPVAKRGSRVSL